MKIKERNNSITINNNTNLELVDESDFIKPELLLHDFNIGNTSNNNSRKIYYISDIHINHKLIKRYPKQLTKNKIIKYVNKLVETIIQSATNRTFFDYLLVGGDISFNYEISEIFYKELRRCWGRNIVVILGNHELWNYTKEGKEIKPLLNLETIINKYRKLFKSLDISFLQNELLLIGSSLWWDGQSKIISEKELIRMTENELRNECLKSRLAILGGIGFSGYNNNFNACSGIYRHTILSLDDDIEQSNKFKFLYEKMEKIIPNNNLIVFTHTPKTDWSNSHYKNNWIYVSGHTHKNTYSCDETKTIYSDNQVGYYSNSIGLKFFEISKSYDIFKYYDDGIYQISRDEYLEFNYGHNIRMTFNRKNGIIKMLKHKGIYCFFFENITNGRLYLLNGGSINKIKNNDVNYYFDKMIAYSNIIKDTFREYNKYLKDISNDIKRIGGSGKIHGCIVDIDYFSHLYINLIDGKITPYFAYSIEDKYIYNNLSSLLKKQRKDLYSNYKKLLDEKSDQILLLEGKNKIDLTSMDLVTYISDTSMYEPSRIMKSLQYLTDTNIIRIWNDDIFEKYSKQKNKENLYLK